MWWGIFQAQDVPLCKNWDLVKITFFIKHGFKKAPTWPTKSPETEKLFHQGVSLEPKLQHTCLILVLTFTGGSHFSSQRCASLQILRFGQNCVFCKIWVKKKTLLTKKITSDWKIFHQEISLEPNFCHTCHT